MTYEQFISQKHVAIATSPVPHGELAAHLFAHQRAIVEWTLRRGRAAVFADTGLGKTAMQVEWARHCSAHGCVLIVAPLAVAEQTIAEAARFGVAVEYVRAPSDAPIQITNYDMLHAFEGADYIAVVLDESSILKAHDGATRTRIIEQFARTRWRLACTATPAPNDYAELGNHSEFLGIRTRVEMLAEWFVHDGETTTEWRLKGHGEEPFWRWVCGWAAVARLPSDVGGDDAGYLLPELRVHDVSIEVDHAALRGDGELFARDVRSLSDARSTRRFTLAARVAKVVEICAGTAGPVVVWCELNDEADAIELALAETGEAVVQVAGSDDREVKRRLLNDFATGACRVLVTKPKIAGHGLNWQHCACVVFVGASYSYEQTYQAIRRCWRFGQTRPVDVHILRAETERHVIETYRRKERDAAQLGERLAAVCKEYSGFVVAGRELSSVERECVCGRGWELHLGDCVDVVRGISDASVGYTIFSPPFASLYTYSSSERDMGNCVTQEEFLKHFAFLVPELYRVTKPGRLLSFHCMLLPTSKTRDGFIGMRDFRGELIRLFIDHGWIHHSEVVIWKDPVTAMQRTKALGLLHKQIKKDSCMSRQGIPDYLITMRKPGDNPDPVAHTDDDLPVSMWQRYASPVWMDINQSDTLQRESAREERDEKHICPLQLEVIRRALHLWTRPGDLVLSPFAGIGSEGFEALRAGRRFVGAELKRSYWDQARRNLHAATSQGHLFADSTAAQMG